MTEDCKQIVDEYNWSRPYDAGSALAVALRVEEQTALAIFKELEECNPWTNRFEIRMETYQRIKEKFCK